MISKAVDVEFESLQHQFEDVHPRAVNVASMSAGSADLNKSSWKTAIDKINAHSAVAKCHPTDDLRSALVLYHTIGISSSGVEQNFSKAEWGFGNRRQSAKADTEEHVLRLIIDLAHHNKDEIIKLARKVWCEIYGVSRLGGSRITKGVKRKKALTLDDGDEGGVMANTETEFIKKRRHSAAAASAADNDNGHRSLDADALMENAASGVGGPEWGKEHMQELVFQRTKLRARKVQAVAEGILDGDDCLQTEVSVVREGRLKEQQARMRKQARQKSRLTGKTASEIKDAIRGKSVYIDSGAASSHHLDAALARMSMPKVSMHEAEVFIAEPGQSGQRVKLATCLRGAFQVSPKLLLSASGGTAIKWEPVAKVPRIVYVSEACNARHKNTVNFISSVLCSMPSSKWELKVDESWDSLAALRLKYAKTPARVIALVRLPETALPVRTLDGKHVDTNRTFSLKQF